MARWRVDRAAGRAADFEDTEESATGSRGEVSMKFTLRGASGAALIVGLAGGLFPAWAQTVQTNGAGPQETAQTAATPEQTAPAAGPQGSGERIVVTGSLIAGTPEDAALPVEVYSAEELEEQGAPTALEFVKNLTISGPTSGEAYYFAGAAATGSPSFNLRGIGADKTLTLLNGRRMSENASNIPSAAIARTEILKDGAAVTYGADATGGVVNFITRESFNGLEVRGQYKYIDGSDGDYGLSVLGGFGEGDTNFLWSAEWEHRSQLDTLDRDWVYQPYYISNAAWSTLTNLAGWQARGTLPTAPGNTANTEWGNPLQANGAFGAAGATFSDFTPSSCAAVGGFYVSSSACAYNYISYYNLVEDQDIYRVFGQVNSRISDNMDFHGEVAVGVVDVPKVYGSPAQPVVRGPAQTQGASHQFFVPRTNPYFGEFATRSGLAANPGFANVTGVTPLSYRALAHGGNPVLGAGKGFGVPSRINNLSWRAMGELSGNLGEWAGPLSEVNYKFATTFNQFQTEGDAPDILGYRLQEALNGFGGPACNAVDLDPNRLGTQNPGAAGRNGCLWWNPFASAFPNQPELGLANPNYRAGSDNPEVLYSWITDLRKTETETQSLYVDLAFDGATPIELPGGTVRWALGTQWGQVEFKETVRSNLFNGSTPCEWPVTATSNRGTTATPNIVNQIPRNPTDPLFNGCTPDEPGPFVFFATNRPDAADRQQISYFGELAIPVFDFLNFSAAVRREEFSGGLAATVYKVSGNWNVWGPLSIRGSVGTNYQTPPLGIIPGEISRGTTSYTVAGGNWRGSQTITASDLKPETADASNIGAIWQSQGIMSDHDFRLIVDYFKIETKDEIGTLAGFNQIADSIFTGAAVGGFRLANCSHPLIGRVTFNDSPTSPNGACVQGTTTANDFSSISTIQGNAFGQTTAGFDIQAQYSLPAFGGDLTFDLTGTKVTELTTSARTLDGFVVAAEDDRLGFSNFAAANNAGVEWRLNFYTAYAIDRHNLRLQFNYISGVDDERGPFTPPGSTFGVSTFGVKGDDWFTQDLYYNLDITDSLRLTASLVNIFDRKPPQARQELSYDPLIGSPLGRTFEIGVKQVF
jgi:iron complex outermembrane recepter protein